MPAFQYTPSGQLINPLFRAAAAIGQGGQSSLGLLDAINWAKESASQGFLEDQAQKLQMAHALIAERGQTPTQGARYGSQNSELGPSIAQQMTQKRFDTSRQDRMTREQTQAEQDATKEAAKAAAVEQTKQAKWNAAHSATDIADEGTKDIIRQLVLDPKATTEDVNKVILGYRAGIKNDARKEMGNIQKANPGVSFDQPPAAFVSTDPNGGLKISDQAGYDAYINYMIQQQIAQGGGRGAPAPAAPQPQAVTGGRGGGPVRVNTPQEALALPPGTAFITPDGRLKVRP